MIIFGVYKIEQLGLNCLTSFFGKRQAISILLFNKIKDKDLQYKNELSKIILERFQVEGGVYKRTYEYRFRDFDLLAGNILNEVFYQQENLKVHDLAVSDGTTAYNFYDYLTNNLKQKIQFHASDKDSVFYYISYKHAIKNGIVIDGRGNVLQIVFPPFVFNTLYKSPKKAFFFINNLIETLLTFTFCKRLLKKHKNKCADVKVEVIKLISEQCIFLDKNEENFDFFEYDVFTKASEKYNIVRAMNILNISYFSSQQLVAILKNIYESLEINGVFITGSNQGVDSIVYGGVFQKTSTGFILLSNSYDYVSPVNNIILGHKFSSMNLI